MSEILKFYADLTKSNQKVVMHCRQGHGRTGTTVTILSRLLQRLYRMQDLITTLGTLSALRAQRKYLCETSEQYRFVNTMGNEGVDFHNLLQQLGASP